MVIMEMVIMEMVVAMMKTRADDDKDHSSVGNNDENCDVGGFACNDDGGGTDDDTNGKVRL